MKKLVNIILVLVILYNFIMMIRNIYITSHLFSWKIIDLLEIALFEFVFVIGYLFLLIINVKQIRNYKNYSIFIIIFLSVFSFALINPFQNKFNIPINPYFIANIVFNVLNWLLIIYFISVWRKVRER